MNLTVSGPLNGSVNCSISHTLLQGANLTDCSNGHSVVVSCPNVI